MSPLEESDTVLRRVAAAPEQRPVRPLVAGEVVGERFVIERLVGRGGMGAVYRAADRETGAAVAVKVIVGRGDPERFAQEARILAELAHPAIVRHIAHGRRPDGELYLAMEWLDGEELAHRLARGPLPVDEALALARRVAEGLAAAHAGGVVHRDVKPSNLFLAGGAAAQPRILDFGVARLPRAGAALTRAGDVVGTVGYMAPEQARGAADVDPRADLFALGCVLHECLTGQPVFAGEHGVAVLAKVLCEDAPRLQTLRPDLPDALDDLLARLLAKKPEARPRDAAALVAELDRIGFFGAPTLPVPRRPAILTGAEQRLLSVLLLETPDGEPPAPPAFAPFGADVTQLADGTLLATLAPRGSATDQAARAAALALALRAAHPAASIGLATGRAETGARHAVGPAIDRAAALLRRGAGIHIDEVTAGLLDARFEVTGDGLLVGRREDRLGVRTLLGKPTPCVGREKELGLLEATLAECAAEAVARAVLVTAPPGVGKSRLCHELVARTTARGDARVLAARADPVGAGSSLGLVRQLVRAAAALRDGDGPAEQHAALQAYLGPLLGPDGGRGAVFLAELAGAPSPSPPGPLLRAARQDPRVMGEWLRRAFQEWIAAECARRPLLVVLEDLHWGDLPSVTYLDEALRARAERPLMVLALARPEIHDLFPRLWVEAGVQEVRLAGLTRRAGERLVRAVLGDRVAEAEMGRLVDRADGNAYYLEELIRQVAEGKGGELPETVLAMAQARLERLEPEARRILRAASVFGEVFRDPGVTALLGGGAPDTTAWLRTLADRELLVARDGAEYAFRHGLLRDAAYASLTAGDLVAAHGRAAEWLEAAGESDPLLLASHFELGGELRRAVPWFLQAAQRAFEGGNVEGASVLAERAIAAGAAGETRGTLRVIQAMASMFREDWSRAIDRAAEGMSLLAPGSAYWLLAAASIVFGGATGTKGEIVRATLQALAALPGDTSATGPYAFAMGLVSIALIYQAQREAGLAFLDRLAAVAARDTQGDPPLQGWLAVARAHAQIHGLGDRPAAVARAAEALRWFDLAGDPYGRTCAAYLAGLAHIDVGAFRQAELHLREARTLADRWGLSFNRNWATLGLAFLFTVIDRVPETLAEVATLESAGAPPLFLQLARAAAAAGHLACGRPAEAEQVARKVLEEGGRLRSAQIAALLVIGRIELERGNHAEGLDVTERAIAKHERGPYMPLNESRLCLLRAELLHALGRLDEARAAIRDARDRIMKTAVALADPALRAGYLDDVPSNARTLALARAWLPDPDG